MWQKKDRVCLHNMRERFAHLNNVTGEVEFCTEHEFIKVAIDVPVTDDRGKEWTWLYCLPAELRRVRSP